MNNNNPNPVPDQNSTPNLNDPFADIKQKFEPLLQQSKPALGHFVDFWQQHRLKIILIFSLAILAIVLLSAIYLGSNLARQQQTEINPPPIAEVTPTPSAVPNSVIMPLFQQYQNFSVILPDPAPPAVDYQIDLNPPKDF